MATLVNLAFTTDKALAQLSPQQCQNIHVQIFNAYLGNGIPTDPHAMQRIKLEMLNTTRQFYNEYPECEEEIYFEGAADTSWQMQYNNYRNQNQMEFMKKYSEIQSEILREVIDLME